MSFLFGKKKEKQGLTESSGRTWDAVKDTRWMKLKSGTLEDLRKQSRDELPRFPVYPFTLSKDDNVVIPYTADVPEIIPYLRKDMTHFKCGVIALVWKGSFESYEALCSEFKNRDYYRRKLVVEYLVYHDMFPMNGRVLGEVILDGHELVVKAALEKVAQYHIFGLKEEILMAMECWPDHGEIQRLCRSILDKYEVRYKRVIDKQQLGVETRKRNTLIFQGSSQTVLKDRSWQREYFDKYLEIIRRYRPSCAESDARALLEQFAEEGCGYAALATTLVQHFAGMPERFREHFGEELLQGGQYITDRLMLDFYCMTDGPNRGMSVEQMNERFHAYCESYGVTVSMECLTDRIPVVCKQCLENGYLLLFAGNFTMYFAKYQPSHVYGWHIMNITDVAQDGTVTVVSWGRTYTMQMKDMRPNYHFVHVTYSGE